MAAPFYIIYISSLPFQLVRPRIRLGLPFLLLLNEITNKMRLCKCHFRRTYQNPEKLPLWLSQKVQFCCASRSGVPHVDLYITPLPTFLSFGHSGLIIYHQAGMVLISKSSSPGLLPLEVLLFGSNKIEIIAKQTFFIFFSIRFPRVGVEAAHDAVEHCKKHGLRHLNLDDRCIDFGEGRPQFGARGTAITVERKRKFVRRDA